MPDDKPGTPDEINHHGVKGQRWGVRRDKDLLGRAASRSAKVIADKNEATKEYISIAAASSAKALSPKVKAKNLAENKEKFANKFSPSEAGDPGKGLSPQQKKLLIGAAVGVGLVGGIYVARKTGHLKSFEEVERAIKAKHLRFAGKNIPPDEFQELVFSSQAKTWLGGGYITESALARPAFELPAGHTFHRISTAAESSWRIPPGTYCLDSVDDFNRYIFGFAGEKGVGTTQLSKVTFKTTKPLKVPDLTTVLETTREILSSEFDQPVSRQKAASVYTGLSGGGWTSTTSVKLIEALKKKGYGALVDEMDAGVIGERPLVMFADHLTSKTSEPITKTMIDQAGKNLIEITNRKL